MNNQDSPLVSVVMPCYNAAQYIAESIESVIAQTHRNWELIIVDDCSKDNSVEIIQDYQNKDDRIKLIRNAKSSGSPAEPRNIGIEHSTGEYIAFLDSDDIWTSDKLQKQLAKFQEGDYAIVYANYEVMREDGSRTGKIVKGPAFTDYKQLLKYNSIGCSGAIFRKEFLNGCRFKKIGHEDYLFWLTFLRNGGTAANSNEVQLIYRERESSVSGNKVKAAKWTWNIYRKELGLNILESSFSFLHYVIKGIERHIGV